MEHLRRREDKVKIKVSELKKLYDQGYTMNEGWELLARHVLDLEAKNDEVNTMVNQMLQNTTTTSGCISDFRITHGRPIPSNGDPVHSSCWRGQDIFEIAFIIMLVVLSIYVCTLK